MSLYLEKRLKKREWNYREVIHKGPNPTSLIPSQKENLDTEPETEGR